MEKEIQRRVLALNRTYFAAISLFRSRLLSRVTKIVLCKILIGDRGSTVVKMLCYKSEGRWFDPSWCRCFFH